MSCMRCYVMLKTFSCFLSEFKCSRLLDPSSFTSRHPEVSQCYRTPSPKALDISPVHMFLCKIKEKNVLWMLLWCSLLLIVWIDGWTVVEVTEFKEDLCTVMTTMLPSHLSRLLQTQMCFQRSWETFKTVKQQKREHTWCTRGTEI